MTTMQNQRILITEPGSVILEDIPMPVPGSNEALLKVLFGGLCGSDLGTYRGTFVYASYPRVPGHELAVEVVQAPENSLGISAGMRGTVNPYFNCGKCYPCRTGHVNCCTDNETMGAQRDGGLQRFITMPLQRIYPATDLGVQEIALIEPFCISTHGVKRTGIQPGEKVLIIGAGTIGILAMLAAKHMGAEVYVTDIAPKKLDHAARLGAVGTFLNTSPETLASWVDETTSGEGFPAVIEAVGTPSTFGDSIDSAAFSGRVVLIGVSKNNLDFNFTLIQKKELTVSGSRNALPVDFPDVINLMRQTGFKAESVVTDIYPFDQAARAFKEFADNPGDKLKVLLDFQ